MLRNPRIKYNVHYLKDRETSQSFRVSLSSRCRPMQDLSIEYDWIVIREVINRTSVEVLAEKAAEHEEWITPETMESINTRRV